MSEIIRVSIIIPTYNRAKILERNLLHILNLDYKTQDYEVIVVDNGSNDNTREVVSGFMDKVLNLQYVYEDRPGLHQARHRGMHLSRGEILCFLDDDSFVDKKWLSTISNGYKESDVCLLGGPILPVSEIDAPKWVEFFWRKCAFGRYMGQLSLLDFGLQERFVPAAYTFGCNFTIRKSVLLSHQGFNPDSVPKDLLCYRGDGESGLAYKLNASGVKLLYSPGAGITHYMPASRYTEGYFVQRGYRQGITDSFTELRQKHGLYGQKNFQWPDELREEWEEFKKQQHEEINASSEGYEQYNEILLKVKVARDEGFKWHQQIVCTDKEILSYVLRDTYIDDNADL